MEKVVSGRREGKRREKGRSYSSLYILDFHSQGDGKPLERFEQRKGMHGLGCERLGLGPAGRIVCREQEQSRELG